MASEVDAVLALLNSTPIVAGVEQDLLDEEAYARDVVRGFGGRGSRVEVRELARARSHLQAAVRTGAPPEALTEIFDGVASRVTRVSADGIHWDLSGPDARLPAARAVMAWSNLVSQRPGRLRACANDECQRFLVDATKGNTARWCSMAVCGNRDKVAAFTRRLKRKRG